MQYLLGKLYHLLVNRRRLSYAASASTQDGPGQRPIRYLPAVALTRGTEQKKQQDCDNGHHKKGEPVSLEAIAVTDAGDLHREVRRHERHW